MKVKSGVPEQGGGGGEAYPQCIARTSNSQSFLPHGQVKVPAEACEEVASDLEHLLNSILVTAGKKGLI